MSLSETGMHNKLNDLKQEYLANLDSRIEEARRSWAAAHSNGWDWPNVRTFNRLMHSLAGSGAIYGLQELSAKARSIEHILTVWLKENRVPDASEHSMLDGLLRNLDDIAAESKRCLSAS